MVPTFTPNPPPSTHSVNEESSSQNSLIVPEIHIKKAQKYNASTFIQSRGKSLEGSESVPSAMNKNTPSAELDYQGKEGHSKEILSSPEDCVKMEKVDIGNEDSCESYHSAVESFSYLIQEDYAHDLAERYIAATRRASGILPTVSSRELKVVIENAETMKSHILSYNKSVSNTSVSEEASKVNTEVLTTSSAIDYCRIVSGCKKRSVRITQFPAASLSCPSLGISSSLRNTWLS